MCIDIEDAIYLFDNGSGMDSRTISECWMLIGTANKRDNFKSKKNRVFESGTIFVIKKLRDQWTKESVRIMIGNLGTLLPPKEQEDFFLCTMDSLKAGYQEISNGISEDFAKLFTDTNKSIITFFLYHNICKFHFV